MGSVSENGVLHGLPYLDLAYELNNSEATAKELAYSIQPSWRDTPEQIQIVQFKEGITNTVRWSRASAHVLSTDGRPVAQVGSPCSWLDPG